MAVNYALATQGGVVTASSTFADAAYSTASVIDGFRHTRGTGTANSMWCANAGTPAWLEVAFPKRRTLNVIEVVAPINTYWNNSNPTYYDTFSSVGNTDFAVQFWDGSAWINIADVADNNRVVRRFEFSPITTSKIRVYITGVQDGFGRIVEIEAWGADEVRLFPLEFSKLGTGSLFNTTINSSTVSGYEQRIKQRNRAKDRFNAALAVGSLDDAKKLRNFFINCGGRYETFLLKDPSDYKIPLTATEFEGDGVRTEFQIRKKYSDLIGNDYYREITRPKVGSIDVYLDGSDIELEKNAYAVDYETGIITFDDAPENGVTIEVEGEFYKNCRFDTDSLDSQLLEYWVTSNVENALVQAPEIPIVEVLS